MLTAIVKVEREVYMTADGTSAHCSTQSRDEVSRLFRMIDVVTGSSRPAWNMTRASPFPGSAPTRAWPKET